MLSSFVYMVLAQQLPLLHQKSAGLRAWKVRDSGRAWYVDFGEEYAEKAKARTVVRA